jgi:hypothetical protein
MCVDCVLTSPRIAQVDPGDGPPFEVVLSHHVLQLDLVRFINSVLIQIF